MSETRTVDVLDREGRQVRYRRAACRALRRTREYPADPPGGYSPAGGSASGHSCHQEPWRGARRWRETLPSEGHRSRPPGLETCAAVRRRRHNPRTAATQLCATYAQEDDHRSAARRALRPGSRRPRLCGSELVSGDTPSTKAAVAALAAVTSLRQGARCHPSGRGSRLAEPAQRGERACDHRRPAQRL